MFKPRSDGGVATDAELARQKIIWSVVRGGESVTSGGGGGGRLKRLAAAVYGHHRQINAVWRLKISKALDDVTAHFTAARNRDDEAALKARVHETLGGVPLEVGDVIHLPVRPPVQAYAPEPPPRPVIRLPVRAASGVSLYEFEAMAFDGHATHRYTGGVGGFAEYFYRNSVGGEEEEEENDDNDRSWQERLAALIRTTGYSEAVATGAFYGDRVVHRGVVYDTSFVPDYDVRALVAEEPGSRVHHHHHRCSDAACVNGRDYADTGSVLAYRAALNVRREERVPRQYMSVFLTFPFKDGHYVRPDGTITFLDVGRPRRASVASSLAAAAFDFERDVVDAARTLRLEDVLAYAVSADRLAEQGAALLTLRQMVGNTLRVNDDVEIRLPYANQVLAWLDTKTTTKTTVLLPSYSNGYRSAGATSLVRDIAANVRSKLAATFVCSAYHVMEIDYLDVYDSLVTDAELYVFFTLVLQQYSVNAYRAFRDALKPTFTTTGDVAWESKYRVYARPYRCTTAQDRLDSSARRLVTPTDLLTAAADHNHHHGRRRCEDTCTETCEFVDRQLAALAATGDVELTPYQTASYIALRII